MGLDVIAIADHNSAENVRAVIEAALSSALKVLPGIECESVEGVHVLTVFDNPEDASKLTNLEVFTKSRNLPKLPDGQYYHHQLIGLKVWEADELLGELVEIMETGANDVYAIQAEDGTDLLIPAIPQVIKEIDTVAGTMKVELLEGLRD